MEQTSITIKDLIEKRHELEKECRHKTSIIKMREITKNFLSQQGLTDEDRIEADIQLAKLVEYLGEVFEAMEIFKKHIKKA